MIYTKDSIIAKHNSDKLKYLLFWGHTSKGGSVGKECLSQWYDCSFEADGVKYRTAEQYMMAQKALLFGDEDIFGRIMKAGGPDTFKKLGQQVRGFDEEKWKASRSDIVIRGNMAKFSQNAELKAFLLGTGDKVLVEASPYDKIWGIGIGADDKRAENPNLWRGLNLLGFCLMEVRDKLKEE